MSKRQRKRAMAKRYQSEAEGDPAYRAHLQQLELHRALADHIKERGFVNIGGTKVKTVGAALALMKQSNATPET